jgi:RecA/RadA recombinase
MEDIEVIGNIPDVLKIPSGVFSLDWALHGGLPVRRIYEIYGHEHVGKSTFVYYLAGVMAKSVVAATDAKKAQVSLCDFEGFDPDYVKACMKPSGFKGQIKLLDSTEGKAKKQTLRPHEEMLQELVDDIYSGASQTGIFDSVGAFVPMAEGEGDIGEAFMGQRAKRIAQFSRRAARTLITPYTPASALFVVNHMHQVIGGHGHTTAGGETLKFLAGVRLWMYNQETIDTMEGGEKKIIAFAIGGNVEKLKDGGKGRKFQLINIPGFGISPEMSAVYDCLTYKLASREASGVKIDGKSMGRLTKLVEYAKNGHTEKFEPFYDLLANQLEEVEVEDDEESNIDSE